MHESIGILSKRLGVQTNIMKQVYLQYKILIWFQCFTHPILIFDVHVSSSLNKAFHCVVTTFAGCNMQGSLLIGEKYL